MKLTNPNQSLLQQQLKNQTRKDNTNKRKNLRHVLLLFGLALTAGGCQNMSPNAPVIPRANATFDTTGLGKTKNIALGNAMNNASLTCKQYTGTRVIVTKDSVKYNGLVDEKTGALIDKAGQVVGILAGHKLPTATSDTDYEVSITFKCVK